MSDTAYYSVRMHASAGSRHVSGAERIVTEGMIDGAVSELVSRAMNKGVPPDRIAVSIDSLGDARPRTLKALDITVIQADDQVTARILASNILRGTGVSDKAVARAIGLLTHGASPSGQNMRGAVIMNSESGERLEPDQERGVRATRFDWSPEANHAIRKELAGHGLSHFRTREALSLATKVVHGPGVIAELCWSDDPDYTAGYVASRSSGYVRFPVLKQPGHDRGGRVIFTEPRMSNARILIDYLQCDPVLIDSLGSFIFTTGGKSGFRSTI